MKSFIKFGMSLTFVASIVLSCKKSGEIIYTEPTCAAANIPAETTKATILGKWNIVTDSSYTKVGCCYEHNVYYAGKPSDYFDFRDDGKLYTKEGINLDTVTYQATSNSVVLSSSGEFLIKNLTAHYINLKTPDSLITFGMSGWRRISLSR